MFYGPPILRLPSLWLKLNLAVASILSIDINFSQSQAVFQDEYNAYWKFRIATIDNIAIY